MLGNGHTFVSKHDWHIDAERGLARHIWRDVSNVVGEVQIADLGQLHVDLKALVCAHECSCPWLHIQIDLMDDRVDGRQAFNQRPEKISQEHRKKSLRIVWICLIEEGLRRKHRGWSTSAPQQQDTQTSACECCHILDTAWSKA
jgi:hypothetical protein